MHSAHLLLEEPIRMASILEPSRPVSSISSSSSSRSHIFIRLNMNSSHLIFSFHYYLFLFSFLFLLSSRILPIWSVCLHSFSLSLSLFLTKLLKLIRSCLASWWSEMTVSGFLHRIMKQEGCKSYIVDFRFLSCCKIPFSQREAVSSFAVHRNLVEICEIFGWGKGKDVLFGFINHW